MLWNRGYAFDYVSDRQVLSAEADSGLVKMRGGNYRAIVVPPTQHMPVSTFRRLLALAEAGATVIFEERLPHDVPGWCQLPERRREFKALRDTVKLEGRSGFQAATLGRGRVLSSGNLDSALAEAGVGREPMFDQTGLMCLRRAIEGGWFYFIANRSEKPLEGWVPLARRPHSALVPGSAYRRLRRGQAAPGAPQTNHRSLWLAPGESRSCGARLLA